MTPSAIAEELPHYFEDRMTVFLKGAPGIGKSDVIRQTGKALGLEVRDWLRASQMDPTDVKGFPCPDAKANVIRWLPPNFLPQDKKSKGILFLDELTSGPVMVQAALYQLMLDRRVGDYVLPDGWFLVGAGNREIDRSIVNKMPAALANRMAHIDVEPNLDDWVRWANKNGVDEMTTAFLRFRPNLLHSFNPDSKEAAFPSPRTWVMADKIQKRNRPLERTAEMLKGVVGEAAANEYAAFLKVRHELPEIEDIFLNPTDTKVPAKPDVLFALTSMLDAHITKTDQFRTASKYVERLPKEFQVVFVKDQLYKRNDNPKYDIRTTSEYTAWARANHNLILA